MYIPLGDKAKAAFEHYKKYLKQGKKNKNTSCFEPCAFMSIKIVKEEEKLGASFFGHEGYIEILFNEYIHETAHYYFYDALSFIAEIGGYFGLFLGYSVLQITSLSAVIGKKMRGFLNEVPQSKQTALACNPS